MARFLFLPSSTSLAWLALLFGLLTAVSAFLGVWASGRELDAAVDHTRTEAQVEIAKAKADSHERIERLRADSNERIAALQNEAEVERGLRAKAEEQAARDRLELARVKVNVGARYLTDQQKSEIIDALKGKKLAPFTAIGEIGDGESMAYAHALRETLLAAGMTLYKGAAPINGVGHLSAPGNPVIIYLPPGSSKGMMNLNDPVFQALSRVIDALAPISVVLKDRNVIYPDYYYIYVGQRSAPHFEK